MSAISTTTRVLSPLSTARVASQGWLRRWLAMDAVVTAACGVAYLAASGPLGRFLGLAPELLLGVGAFQLAYAGVVGWLAGQQRPPAVGVTAVVETNLVWTVASVAVLAFWLTPTTAGTVWVLYQAAAVGGFAVAQYLTLRKLLRSAGSSR